MNERFGVPVALGMARRSPIPLERVSGRDDTRCIRVLLAALSHRRSDEKRCDRQKTRPGYEASLRHVDGPR